MRDNILRKSLLPILFVLSLLPVHSFGDINAAGSKQLQHSTKNQLLQFKSGNHILGFKPDKAYLAAPDHALVVEFLGTKGVMPIADTDGTAKGSATKVMTLSKVVYKNLWVGISLTYECRKDGATESTYHVAPGADVSKIRLKYNVPVEAQKDGSLKFKFDKGYLTESAPVAWQEIKGRRAAVKVAFKVEKGEVGFSVGKYDSSRPLVIDPTYAWHTFYGTGTDDGGERIATDSNGNVYITGYSYSTWGAPLHEHSVYGANIFVLKLNSSGEYQWHTFYGPAYGYSIAVDRIGNVYVTGAGGSWGNPLHAHSASSDDIFVLKLDSEGTYQWHTFYGSSDSTHQSRDIHSEGCDIAVDSSENVYVAGLSGDTWGSPLHAYSGDLDIVVLKLNSLGAYQWHTFYGASGTGYNSSDYGYGIAVDNNSNVFVTGWSGSTWGNPLNAFTSGDGNIFILKLNNNGDYQWHTFYGSGSANGSQEGIAVDSAGNVYVAGVAGVSWGSPLNAFSGGNNIFVIKLNGSGVYQWHTFYEAVCGNFKCGLAADTNQNIYVAGESGPWGSPLNAHNGSSDLIVLKLNSRGEYQWHTFYGSASPDGGSGIAVDGSGNVYVTGYSNATWGSPLNAFIGYSNISVLKLAPTTCPDDPVVKVVMGQASVGIAHFSSISAAYNDNMWSSSLSNMNIINLQAIEFTESPNLWRDVIFTLSGGYECGFASNPGRSVINGTLTISGGTMTIENIVIR